MDRRGFFEHTTVDRLTVGILTIVLQCGFGLQNRAAGANAGLAAVGAVILQGVLGGLRVTMLKDKSEFSWLSRASFFALMVYRTGELAILERARRRHSRWRIATGIALLTTRPDLCSTGAGCDMRHQHRDLFLSRFPTAYGHLYRFARGTSHSVRSRAH